MPDVGVPVVSVGSVVPDAGVEWASVGSGDPAYVIFTSGSTGRPKGVVVGHGALAAHVAAARECFAITPGDRVLSLASLSFDASLEQILPALTTGATVVLRPDEIWSVEDLAARVREHRITVTELTPSYWEEVVARLDTVAPDLAGLRLLVTGGEALPAAPLGRWFDHLPGVPIVNTYGPTEAVVSATAHRVTAPVPGRVPIGRPLGSRRALVVDRRGRPVPVGVPGELLIGGPELALGYLGRPGPTAERFVPDPSGEPGARVYRTGDLVRRLPSGDLEFLGRTDDQVKIRGFRVEPGEIEAVLAECPGVTAAAVTAGPDGPGGRRLIAHVVPAEGTEPSFEALRSHCADHLPDHAVPSFFTTLDRLPVNASGKLDRAALPAPEPGRITGGTPHVPPRDDTERTIAAIWAEVLGVERVGIDDGFFDLGGHSLLATMAVSRVAERLGREIELRTLFENPRIREFAPVVTAARRVDADTVVPADREGPLPLSFAQERLWFLDRMSPLGEDYVLWYCRRVRGGLDRVAWQGALDDVAARHEVLRTALIEVDGRPVQQIRPPAPVPLEWHPAPAGGHGDAGEDVPERVRERAVELARRRFALDEPPMLRSGVWELGPEDHVAVVAFHHVAIDGWSKDVFLEELSACYRARLAGTTADLPPLPVQYADFAVWQRERAASPGAEAGLRYWETALAGVPPLELPTDRPRPAVRSGRGGAVEIPLGDDLPERIDALARRHGATRFMVLLAVVQVVLARWSGQEDIAVGTPVAGRDRVELERLIGFFVNTVVLRGDLSGDPAFTEHLERVRADVLGAFDHREVPFEHVVNRLRPERDLSRTPLFQVMFDVQEGSDASGRLLDREVGTIALPWRSAKFDLTVTFVVSPGRFALNVEYSDDLFEPDTVTRFAEHVGRALVAALDAPTTPVGDLELCAPSERAALTAAGTASASAGDAPRPVRLWGGGGSAVVCGDRVVSYGELEGLSGGVAGALRGAGVGVGDAVGVCVGRGVWSVAAMWGVWRAGGVYVPLDPALPVERLRYMVAEAGVGVVV
ncbi:amino acid adenylation domain-containing protein, partial [Streptomyces calidiresistens]|uniref:amino acid adenylation domain-containing protein n=1 Tax=Streptomyces calidiresistens TaxID=1485586 RepID=UPI002B2068FD